ncbi:MAG TPA: hypothetical protein GXZ55_07725 [Natronincola sp.]|nr:hypothetical protein [Natronincola sp.]
MELTSKLRKFLPRQNTASPHSSKKRNRRLDLDGQEIMTPYGACYVVEKSFPLSEYHGHWALGKAYNNSYACLEKLGQRPPKAFHMQNALFLDTETTGLAGGTGTYAFLVGLGTFTESNFIVKQFLMRDYNEELAMLYLLNKELKSKNTIISFNGKTFDLPLLQTRFTISRLPLEGAKGKDHLDLLHMARRLWRHKLASCSLNSLETHVLGITRHDDIPGFEIPSRYFEFLHTGQGHILKQVLDHNVIDILSMATLSHRLATTAKLKPEECVCPWEAEALAKQAFSTRDYSLSLAYYTAARNHSQNGEQYSRILHSTALIHKRMGQLDDACLLWKKLLEVNENDLLAHEELAKYYEHRLKDLNSAQRVTKHALAIAWSLRSPKASDFEHRLQRIDGKSKGKNHVNA